MKVDILTFSTIISWQWDVGNFAFNGLFDFLLCWHALLQYNRYLTIELNKGKTNWSSQLVVGIITLLFWHIFYLMTEAFSIMFPTNANIAWYVTTYWQLLNNFTLSIVVHGCKHHIEVLTINIGLHLVGLVLRQLLKAMSFSSKQFFTNCSDLQIKMSLTWPTTDLCRNM